MKITLIILSYLLLACSHRRSFQSPKPDSSFGRPVRIEMKGYTGNIMEPFFSRDGKVLLFNNLNSAPENTNLHWAERINDSNFQYKGELTGVNSPELEGVPTMDSAGHLYFVSTRNYSQTLSTVYQCDYLDGHASNVHLLQGVSKLKAGWVNFDVEVSSNGQSLYFVDAKFNGSGQPTSADLVLAQKTGGGFQRAPETDSTLQNINTDALEYAASISADNLTLYFTRVLLPVSENSTPEILFSTRPATKDPFGPPSKIMNITGFAEAPAISPNQKILYYHKKEKNLFVLYMVRKK
jgi:WD40-like Beta Propeller Repeat